MRQRRLVLAGDQRQLCVVLDPAVEVDEAAVDLGDESRLGEAGADVRGHLGRRHRMRIGTDGAVGKGRSEEHTSELQSLMRISYAVFCLKKTQKTRNRICDSQQR